MGRIRFRYRCRNCLPATAQSRRSHSAVGAAKHRVAQEEAQVRVVAQAAEGEEATFRPDPGSS